MLHTLHLKHLHQKISFFYKWIFTPVPLKKFLYPFIKEVG